MSTVSSSPAKPGTHQTQSCRENAIRLYSVHKRGSTPKESRAKNNMRKEKTTFCKNSKVASQDNFCGKINLAYKCIIAYFLIYVKTVT